MAEYNLTVNTQKTKLMAFKGQYPVWSKILIANKIREQASSFICLKFDILWKRSGHW
jgi:hypothetical protein